VIFRLNCAWFIGTGSSLPNLSSGLRFRTSNASGCKGVFLMAKAGILSRSSRVRGGKPFSRGALYLLLHNRIYRGEIVHNGQSHRGEHKPIIDGTDRFVAARPDARLIKLLLKARRFNATLVGSDGVPFATLAEREGVSRSYFTRVVRRNPFPSTGESAANFLSRIETTAASACNGVPRVPSRSGERAPVAMRNSARCGCCRTICNPRMHRLSAFALAQLSGKRPMVGGMLCPASRGKGKWTTAAC
jgi:hypothetical protein